MSSRGCSCKSRTVENFDNYGNLTAYSGSALRPVRASFGGGPTVQENFVPEYSGRSGTNRYSGLAALYGGPVQENYVQEYSGKSGVNSYPSLAGYNQRENFQHPMAGQNDNRTLGHGGRTPQQFPNPQPKKIVTPQGYIVPMWGQGGYGTLTRNNSRGDGAGNFLFGAAYGSPQ